jgi:multiple sugar transport system ATP-binding protein
MRAEIKKLHEETGATFVYVTHDQAEALTMSDQIVVLDAGAIQQVGSPHTIYHAPANTFVASFVDMPPINLVRPATLQLNALARGRDVIAGVRPEDLAVGRGPPPGDAVPGRVWVVEPMGAETWVTVSVAGERVLGRAPGDFSARSGDEVWLRSSLDRVLLFDARTERRIDP